MAADKHFSCVEILEKVTTETWEIASLRDAQSHMRQSATKPYNAAVTEIKFPPANFIYPVHPTALKTYIRVPWNLSANEAALLLTYKWGQQEDL